MIGPGMGSSDLMLCNIPSFIEGFNCFTFMIPCYAGVKEDLSVYSKASVVINLFTF